MRLVLTIKPANKEIKIRRKFKVFGFYLATDPFKFDLFKNVCNSKAFDTILAKYIATNMQKSGKTCLTW